MAENNDKPADVSGSLNSPDISPSLKPRARAIKDEQQLKSLIQREEKRNERRNIKNARIMAKYNAEKPHESSELKADGLLWKSNFSTQPLAALIDRIAPRFVRALNSARYLTSARLPDHIQGAAKKTEVFQKEFTSLVRAREGSKDFWAEVSQENALFGYTCAAYTDEYSWFPRHFRQDEFFVPAGTKQTASKAPLIILRETMLPHELFDLIDDKDAAETAGWQIENTVECINKASADDVRNKSSNDARKYEDMHREANLYNSLGEGAKVCILWNVMAVEVTGKVSHYIMDGRDWKILMERHDRFNSMAEVAAFFSFQQANGNLMGSKGVGRTVYNLAGIVDRSRNEVVDRLQLSGKILVQGENKDLKAFKMSVIGNAIVISKNFSVTQHKIEAGVEPFIMLDKWVMSLMDELGGNVSPASASGQLQGERVTNGQINYLADLQAESKDTKIERFLSNAAVLLSQMQRRAANPQCDEEDAKEFREKCLAVMSEEEFQAIAKKPVAQTVEDYTELQRQTVISVTTEVMSNPLIDQKKALRRKLSAAVDADFADDLILPDEDPTQTAEQMRTSELENLLLGMGKQVPVSPRDADLIHAKGHISLAEETAALIANDPTKVNVIQGIVDHLKAHVTSAQQKGAPKDEIQPVIEQIAKLEQGIAAVGNAAQAHIDAQAPAAPIA